MAVKKTATTIPVTIYFVQRTGLIIVATTTFPSRTNEKKMVSRIFELIDEGGAPTHCLDFLSTYTVLDDTISVLLFTPKGLKQFVYTKERQS